LDVLSQAEIDKLLASMQTGEADETDSGMGESVRPYDFKTANRFTREQIRAINLVFKNFGHLFSNHLMAMLRTNCESELLSIEEVSFSEFNNSIPSPVVLAIINAQPFNGSIIMEMTKEISYSIISRVLGGTKEIDSEGRQFTEIELAIIERVLWQSLRIFDESWDKLMEVSSTLEKVETSMQFAQIVDMNEPILLVTLNVIIGAESGLMCFCLPHQVLEPFTKKLSTRHIYSTQMRQAAVDPERILKSIKNTGIEITAEFSPTMATVSEIASLEVGDVIQLSHKVDAPLLLKFQNVPKYRAALGTSKNKLALKILEEVRGDEENE
jgi:flagellar motor switch protein FliM